MKVHLARFLNGETMEIRELDDGTWPCPICGQPWLHPAIEPAMGSTGHSAPAIGDVCGDCGIEFGVDEGCPPQAPVGTMHRQYAYFRARWLERIGWTREALDQLRDNLGMSEAQVKREAAEFRSADRLLPPGS